MNDLLHSSTALNNLDKFHDKFIIYVEGKDDKTFWSYFFESVVDKYHIKVAGGVNELKKYAEMVVSDDINIIIASDSDYEVLFDNHTKHTKIVYTCGYSIENMMHCPKNLNNVIKKRCRLDHSPDDVAHKWMESFCDEVKELLVMDMANEYYGKGKSIMGDSCQKFLTSGNSSRLSTQKIDNFQKNIEFCFHDHEIIAIQNLIKKSEMPTNKIIRGKFLVSAIINFLKQQCTKDGGSPKSLNIETLFNLTVDGCKSCKEHCVSYNKMCISCSDAIDSLDCIY